MGFVELHFHLLPGVDDGPTSDVESLALARAAVRDGSRTVVATPHVSPQYITDPTEIAGHVAALSERLRGAGIPLEVLPGAEVSTDLVGRLSTRELDAVAHGPHAARWLLLEAPLDGLDGRFTDAADELRSRGFAVLMAHPERAVQRPQTAAVLAHELAAGTALQLTAESFTGLFGGQARRLALQFLRGWPRVVIASDAHGLALGRMPALSKALNSLRSSSERDPDRYAQDNPRALLEHGLIYAMPLALSAAGGETDR